MFIKNRFFCTIYSDHGVPFPCSSWILPPYGPTNPNLHFPSHHKQATKKKGKKMCRQIMGYESIMFSHLNCLQQKPSLRVDSFTPSAQHSPSFPSVAKTPKPDEHTLPFFCYICTHTNTQVQTYMCTEGHRHTQTHVFTHCHTHTQSAQRYTYVCIHQTMHIFKYCTWAHIHACTHMSIHIYRVAYLHMYIHVHTQGNSQASIH